MKKTSVILRSASALTAALVCAGPAGAADLFSENFDTEVNAHIGTNNGSGVTVTYVDYSGMTVRAVIHSIPEAPRLIAGSLPTRGVLLKADYTAAATERIANLVALNDAGGSRLALTDNYRLRFDVYLRLSPVVKLTPNGYPDLVENAGSTEQMLWGVGYNAALPMGRQFRTGRGSGMWGFLATEGGHGSTVGGDASLWNNGALAGTRNMDLVNAPGDVANYFTPAFGSNATPVPHCPANQWVQADITVRAGQVTVEYQAAGRTKTKFYENVAGPVAGPVMVGYEDPFGSTSWVPDEQWMLLDNMVVEDITPPTLVVAGAAAEPFAPFRGTPVTGTYNITNSRGAGDLTISAVNFTGTNAADFSLATPLPLVVGPGATRPLNIIFNPAAPNGVKSVSITIVSDDPQTPNYVLSDVRARRSAGSFFEAHYKLDETAGNTLADASGNGAAAALTVRAGFPVFYGQPTLLGAADTGTGIGFTPAQSSAEGNYFTSSVVHTPTFSISLWMKPAVAGAIRTLWQRDYDSLSPYDKICCLQLLADGTLAWRVRSTTVIPGGADPPLPALADGEIRHIVLTHLDEDGFGNGTATRSRLYINGLRVAEKAGADTLGFDDYPPSAVIGSLHVASRTIAGHGFAGDMDDFQVYGAELTREQVWEIYKRAGRSVTQDWSVLVIEPNNNPPSFGITFPSSPEGRYQLFQSSDLQNWVSEGQRFPGTIDALTTTIIHLTPPPGKNFYRIMRE